MFQGVGGFRGMFVADLGGEVAMGLRRLPTLANHCAQRASFALLQGKWIEFRELTYIGQIAYLIGMRQGSDQGSRSTFMYMPARR